MLLNEFRNTQQDLAKKLLEYIKEKEMTINQISQDVGVRSSTLCSFLNGAKVSIVTLSKVEKFWRKNGL